MNESREKEEIQLVLALRQYDVRLGRYIMELRRGNLADVQEWSKSANWAQGLFRQLFAEVTPADIGQEGRRELIAIFDRVRCNEETLKELMTGKLKQMSSQIPRLRKGKAVLQGYAVRGNIGKARFLSSRG